MKPKYVVIHHSRTQDGQVVDWGAIRRYHIEVNGWHDIGYQFGIEEVGGELILQEGRKVGEPGAHCKDADMNSQSIGVCVIGNFDMQPPDLRRLHFLRDLCFALMVNYQIPAQRVIGHRDAGLMAGFDWTKGQYKSCPGLLFPMGTLKDMLSGKIDQEWSLT